MNELSNKLESIREGIANAYDVIEANGGTLPTSQDLAHLATAIESLVSSFELPIPTAIKFQDTNAPYEVFNAALVNWSHISSLETTFLWNSAKKIHNFTTDVPNNTSLYQTFARCANLEEVDLTNVTAQLVTSCRAMCSTSPKLKVFKNSFVFGRNTSLYQAFYDCKNLETITNMGNWDTSTVTDMRSMFRNCYVLDNIDLTNFNCSALVYFETEEAFLNANSLKNIIDTHTLAEVRSGSVSAMNGLVRPLNMKSCPLNFASMLAICKGVGTPTDSKTITFKASAYNALTDDEKTELDTAIAGKNWVIATA